MISSQKRQTNVCKRVKNDFPFEKNRRVKQQKTIKNYLIPKSTANKTTRRRTEKLAQFSLTPRSA